MSRLFATGQYLKYAGSNLLGAVGTAEPLSISLWVKTEAGEGNAPYLIKLEDTLGDFALRADFWQPGWAGRSENKSGAFEDAYNFGPALGGWQHVLLEFASNVSRTVYVNNTAGTTDTDTMNHNASLGIDDVLIGVLSSAISTSLRIAEVAFWTKVLSGAERTTLQTYTPDAVSGAIAYWPLVASLADEVNGWTLADQGSASSFDADHPTLSSPGGGSNDGSDLLLLGVG
jgi:hypothetical protein